jgi:hypothetical protein
MLSSKTQLRMCAKPPALTITAPPPPVAVLLWKSTLRARRRPPPPPEPRLPDTSTADPSLQAPPVISKSLRVSIPPTPTTKICPIPLPSTTQGASPQVPIMVVTPNTSGSGNDSAPPPRKPSVYFPIVHELVENLQKVIELCSYVRRRCLPRE